MSDENLDEYKIEGEIKKRRNSDDINSMGSDMLTPKQYFLVNLSKLVVEMVGTFVLGTFYTLMGD